MDSATGPSRDRLDGVSLAALAAVEGMPAGERIPFVLNDLLGVGFEEIAALTGCAPRVCGELAERARTRLREVRRRPAETTSHVAPARGE